MRTIQSVNQIKKHISDPYSVQNFLSSNDIFYLINLFNSTDNYQNPYKEKIQKNTGPVTLSLKNYLTDPIIKKILKQIELQIGKFEMTAGFFFQTDFPHILHNDDTFELPDTVYKGITIPLSVTRDNDSADFPFLCFFNQFYFHGPSKFFKGSHNISTYYNKCVYDYSLVEGLETKEEYFDPRLFSHLKKEWLTGLSLHSLLDWKPGSMIIFDSVRIHCASDFRNLGIKEKLGISIFTKKISEYAVTPPLP